MHASDFQLGYLAGDARVLGRCSWLRTCVLKILNGKLKYSGQPLYGAQAMPVRARCHCTRADSLLICIAAVLASIARLGLA